MSLHLTDLRVGAPGPGAAEVGRATVGLAEVHWGEKGEEEELADG